MNDFIQIEEYLAMKRMEACDEFDKYISIELTGVDGCDTLSKEEIKRIYNQAHSKVCGRFHDDCEILKKGCPDFGEVIHSIKLRDLKKIKDLKDYKLMLVFGIFEKGGVLRMYTFEKWLSGQAV